MTVMGLSVITSEAENTPDMDKLSEQMQNSSEEVEMNFISAGMLSNYENRMMGVFQDMFDFGYI